MSQSLTALRSLPLSRWRFAQGLTPPLTKGLARCLTLSLLLIHTPAFAWGHLGHRITGDIAAALLTPAAQRQVRALLGDEPLSAAATFMDRERDALSARWPNSARWHYDNAPICVDHAYCGDGQCATRQLDVFRGVLADKGQPRDERAMALRIVVHLLGDLHQPLHMADDNDRGGNDIQVRLYAGAERRSLHEVLDTTLIKELLQGQRTERYAAQLRQQYQSTLAIWSQGLPAQWAAESHQLARDKVYGLLPSFACEANMGRHTLTLSPAWTAEARRYVPEQLTKAGGRIASLLNATLR